MKAWFWTLLVFIAAVGLALVLRDHSGNVLIVAQPWRIELSLALAVLLVLACFVILYIVLRVLAWISGGPERFRPWRSLRSQKREHGLLENGWIIVLVGDRKSTRLNSSHYFASRLPSSPRKQQKKNN